jgi:S-formylglutathione hydrolase FrmB
MVQIGAHTVCSPSPVAFECLLSLSLSMKKIVLPALLISLVFASQAATVDTVSIFSKAMGKAFNCVVIQPDKKAEKTPALPVVYLLHGWSGNYTDWVRKAPAIKQLADLYRIIIVCPDGGYASWYFDSPLDASLRYETYIGTEVPEYIDAHYATINDRKARAITGLSMGGHGALYLSFRHPDRFSACGSMSGGVDINANPRNRFGINKTIGDTVRYADNWNKYSVINIVEQKSKDSLKIIIDCGTEDFFYDVNHALHEKMLRLKIPHDYIERPGKHDWAYWGNAVKYQLLFFRNYFDGNRF